MTNPYESPRESAGRRSRLLVLGVVLIVIAVVMPLLGLAGTIAGMMYSYHALSDSEAASPEALADGVSFSLLTTIVCAVFGIVAAIAGGALIRASRRRGHGQ